MVIDDFNVEGVAVSKPETHAPLTVNAYAPLACPVAGQFFQLVGRRQPQILDSRGSVNLIHTHRCPLQDFCWQPARFSGSKEMFGFRVCECLNHQPIVNNKFILVKRVLVPAAE